MELERRIGAEERELESWKEKSQGKMRGGRELEEGKP